MRVKFYSIDGGMQQIPVNLSKLFQKSGGNLFLETKVDKINWDGKKFSIFTINTVTGKQKEFHAKKVVFAAGQYAVLSLKTNFLNDDKSQILLNSVVPVDLTKIWVTYPDFWWYKINHIYRGVSITNLPVRQILYFDPLYPESKQNTDALLKAAYTGGKSGYYWKNYYNPHVIAFVDGQNSYGYLSTNYDSINPIKSQYNIAKNLLDPLDKDLTKELSEIHKADVPLPKSTLVINWSMPPFVGAVHIWKPIDDIPKTAHEIVNINPNIPFYVVGEAYSLQEGWVEGALETSEYMLEKYFGLGYPNWALTPKQSR